MAKKERRKYKNFKNIQSEGFISSGANEIDDDYTVTKDNVHDTGGNKGGRSDITSETSMD